MLILLSLRKPFSDVNVYRDVYYSLKGVTFRQMLGDFHVLRGSSYAWGLEWGYGFVSWFFVNLGFDFQLFLFFESAFCVFCVFNFVDRNSVNLPLSIALIVGFGLFDYMYVIVRQTISLGFLLLSFEFIKKRNIICFLILVFIASLMHRTALLFLAVWPLSYLSVSWKNILIFSGLSFLIIPLYPLAEKFFLQKIMSLLMKKSYLTESAFEFGELILLILALMFFSVLVRDGQKETEVKDRAAFWAFAFSLPLQVTACYLPILGRVSTLTFLPFAGIAIPNLLHTNGNEKLVKLFGVLIYLAALAYYAFCLFFDKRMLEIVPYRMFFM